MKEIIFGKKAIFFTLIAVSLLGIVLFTYTVTYSYSLQEQSSIIEIRVDTMNRFLTSIDKDLQNAIYIVGYRSLVALSDYCTSNGTYVESANESLEELFINGTIDGIASPLMANNTINDWIERISEKGDEIDIDITLNVSSVSISQVSPWDLRFEVVAALNMSDTKETASWIKDKQTYSDVSIIGFEDVQYALHSGGMVVKRIAVTPYDNNFTVGNDTSNLKDHVANTYYLAFNASPSFLMRFENDFNASEFGIESMVNKTEVSACALSASSIDSLCWQDSLADTWSVKDMNDTNFKIDNETNDAGIGRIDRYGLSGVIY